MVTLATKANTAPSVSSVYPELRNRNQTRGQIFGSTRLRRVIFGVAPRISSDKLSHPATILRGATTFRRDA